MYGGEMGKSLDDGIHLGIVSRELFSQSLLLHFQSCLFRRLLILHHLVTAQQPTRSKWVASIAIVLTVIDSVAFSSMGGRALRWAWLHQPPKAAAAAQGHHKRTGLRPGGRGQIAHVVVAAGGPAHGLLG